MFKEIEKELKRSDKAFGSGFDDDEMVYCRICNIRRKSLTSHIKSYHIKKEFIERVSSVADYEEKYNAPLESESYQKNRAKDKLVKKKMSESAKKRWEGRTSSEYEHRQRRLNGERKCHKCNNYEKVAEMGQGKFVCSKCSGQMKQINFDKKINLKSYVMCPLCYMETGDEVSSRVEFISVRHLAKHHYTMEQFRAEFPYVSLKSKKMCDEHSEKLSGKNHFNYGKKLDQEIYDKGRITRNKNKKNCLICDRLFEKVSDKEGLCNICSFREYGFYDDYEKVHCRICGYRGKTLFSHLFHEHDLYTDDYLSVYSDANVTSQKYSEITKEGREKYLSTIDPDIRLTKSYACAVFGLNWKDQREKIRLSHSKCEHCGLEDNGNKRKFHVHHKIPRVMFNGDWENANKLENLEYLCISCHMLEEAKVRKEMLKNENTKVDGLYQFFNYRGMNAKVPLYKKEFLKKALEYKKVYEDSDDYIYCRECNAGMQEITHTHLAIHKMSFDEYISKYPNVPTSSKKRLMTKSNPVKFLTNSQIKKKWNIIKLKKKKYDDTKSEVHCRLCDYKSSNLVGHISRIHHVDIYTYRKIFKDAPIKADILKSKKKVS